MIVGEGPGANEDAECVPFVGRAGKLLDKMLDSIYLKSHIEIINPKILLLLGSTALNTLIGNEEVISKARGKWFQKEIGLSNPLIIASFHPAFLMRQPDQKKLAWIDLKMIREKYKSITSVT